MGVQAIKVPNNESQTIDCKPFIKWAEGKSQLLCELNVLTLTRSAIVTLPTMWLSPPDQLKLTSNDVHLWRMNLDLSLREVNQRFHILDETEKNKANRFKFEHHKNRFIVARSTLKFILSRYLNIAPEQIKLTYNPYGKPKLLDEINEQNLAFNLSHSQDLAIYGVTCDRLIGVDVEHLRPMPDAEQLVQRFFHPEEAKQLQSLAIIEKHKAFFQLWTAKEAYLKAIGQGISGGLEQVKISLDPPLKYLTLPSNDQTPWNLLSFIPHPNYLAAIAVQGNRYQINYWQG